MGWSRLGFAFGVPFSSSGHSLYSELIPTIKQFCPSVIVPKTANPSGKTQNGLPAIKDAGLYKPERVLETSQQARIGVKGAQRPVVNLSGNNYLPSQTQLKLLRPQNKPSIAGDVDWRPPA